MGAPKISRVDHVCRGKNGLDKISVKRSVNRLRDKTSLALHHRGANAGEVEAEIQNKNSSEPEQNHFGATSHGVKQPN
jgi:hypothetical protein